MKASLVSRFIVIAFLMTPVVACLQSENPLSAANDRRTNQNKHASSQQDTESPAPPVMLYQDASVRDLGAAGGSRTAFAIMRLPDGSFAFYD